VEPKRLGWIDAIVERAKLPQLTDLGGALIAYNNFARKELAKPVRTPPQRPRRKRVNTEAIVSP
jgi:hypothetical protein